MQPVVTSVSCQAGHQFSKRCADSIDLIAGIGLAGDGHAGVTVQHRSRVLADPTQPNLRQVHLIASELFSELATKGFRIAPGDLGENITTAGINLLDLPRSTLLQLGPSAVVEVTGLRNPCAQIDAFQPGLLAAVMDRAADGSLIRKAGIMAIVRASGPIRPGDPIVITLPSPPFERLDRV
jgi:MOSC domain-containing protein YiiM